MKALSVRPEWATLIASGAKMLEIRSRRTHYRGELLICASRGGGAVAIVEIVDCRPFVEADDAASGGVWSKFPSTHKDHYAWVMRLVQRVKSETINGKLSMYDVPESSFVRC
jgi:hypothetical protein